MNRSHVGRMIGALAAAVTSLLVFLILLFFDLASHLGLPSNVPPILLSLLLTGIMFWALYLIFSRYAWRWPILSRLLLVADVSGEWSCNGRTLDNDGSVKFEWSGTITILQSWDKIRVRLKTQQSESLSIAAAFVVEGGDGFRLLYHYQNQPRIGEPELGAHRGFCDLLFDRKLQSAEGDYFNGFGRVTFGRMSLTRSSHGK